ESGERIYNLLKDYGAILTTYDNVELEEGEYSGHEVWVYTALNMPEYNGLTVWQWTADQKLEVENNNSIIIAIIGVSIVGIGIAIFIIRRRTTKKFRID